MSKTNLSITTNFYSSYDTDIAGIKGYTIAFTTDKMNGTTQCCVGAEKLLLLFAGLLVVVEKEAIP